MILFSAMHIIFIGSKFEIILYGCVPRPRFVRRPRFVPPPTFPPGRLVGLLGALVIVS